MTENADPQIVRDVSFSGNIVFGSLSINLSGTPAEIISPRLPFAELGRILEDGEPNLMAALRWEYGLTKTLRGREADLDAVLRWAESGGSTVSVRLVTGPGGAGKTRLAAEASRILRERGWSAGFLPSDARQAQIVDASGRAGGGLLLAIDYPEERPRLVEELFEHVTDIVNPPIPIRFLLVSRRSFDDWRRQADLLGGRFGRHELAAPGPLQPADALAVLREAAERFAGLTGVTIPALDSAEAWLARAPVNRLALIAMTAGVHAALTGRGDFALGAPELMREIARRELRRVQRVSRAAGLGTFGLERLLGAALMNADGLDAARVEALGALDIAPGITGQALLDALAQTPWWGRAPLCSRRLDRLEPDRPAAAFLHAALLDDPQPRLPDWLYAASAGTGREFGPVLSRLAWDLTELSADGRGALPLERALLAMIDKTPERAADFTDIGFEEGTAFSAAFAARVLEQTLVHEHTPEKKAVILNNLGNYFLTLGRHEKALNATSIAIEIRRQLFATEPGSIASSLATSLNNLANMLSTVGRREDAFTAAAEAVDISRQFTNDEHETSSLLAMTLTTLARVSSNMGQNEEALNAAIEAVRIYRRLAPLQAGGSSAHGLAVALNAVTRSFLDLGRVEEANATAEDAVAHTRQLAAVEPQFGIPDLAMALSMHANFISVSERPEQALGTATEAVSLYRQLAAARPGAFDANLGASLNALTNVLAELGRREEALAISIEAVDLNRQLVTILPKSFLPKLAAALGSMANRLSDLGQHDHAIKAAVEAMQLITPLFLSQPIVFRQITRKIISVYVITCQNASQEPSITLLTPVYDAFNQ